MELKQEYVLTEVEEEVIAKKMVQKLCYICPFCDYADEGQKYLAEHMMQWHTFSAEDYLGKDFDYSYVDLYKFETKEKLDLFIEMSNYEIYKGEFNPGWFVKSKRELLTIDEFVERIKIKILDVVKQ